MALSKDERRAKNRRAFLDRVQESASTSDPTPDRSSNTAMMDVVSLRPRLRSSKLPPKQGPKRRMGPKRITRKPWVPPVKWSTYKCPLPHDDGEPRFFRSHDHRVEHLRDVHGWV